MSESIPPNSEAVIWRLKKSTDDTIYGPVNDDTLLEWANSAQISPYDFIDNSDDNWRPAPEIEFLKMIWIVKLPKNELYGPTTVGTIREFKNEGLIDEKTPVTCSLNQQILPLEALLASAEAEEKRAKIKSSGDQKKSSMEIHVEMAKDQRIRQLEADLRNLKAEHETLLQKYRLATLNVPDRKITRPLPPR